MNYVSYDDMSTIVDSIKDWVLSKLKFKQDKLTAGAGVSISSENVISTETNAVVEVNIGNYEDYLKKESYTYQSGEQTITKEMRGWTLDTSNSKYCGTYYFTEDMKDIITPQQPIMRIGKTEWGGESDTVGLNKMNGCRITLAGYFQIGMYVKSKSGKKKNQGQVTEFYYNNIEYDTEVDTTISEGLIKIVDEFDEIYITDCSSRQHYLDLLCWKLRWFTKGYIK